MNTNLFKRRGLPLLIAIAGLVPLIQAAAPDREPGKRAATWVQSYADPTLSALVESALGANPDLAAAQARRDEARAGLKIARSAFFPQIGAQAGWTRGRDPSTGSGATGELATLGGDLSWEIDLAGRVRHQNSSARALLEASAADLDAAALQLAADTATTYFALVATAREGHVIDEGIALRKRALQIISSRVRAGAATELDLARTEAELATSEADAAETKRRLATLRHALAVLTGASALENAPAIPDQPTLANPPARPDTLPSTLLARRPDIFAAGRSFLAASARIGVARADFFPRIDLLGTGGYASADINSLTDWANRAWSLGPRIYLPLFQGGRNRAQLARAEAQADQAEAAYRAASLRAFQEVADALVATDTLGEQAEAQLRALTASRRAAQLSQRRYDAGAVSYLDVIDAERTRLAAERETVQLSGQRLIASVNLTRALGGGWQNPDHPVELAAR